MTDNIPNTPEQIAAHEANERLAQEELSYPLFQVQISGDEVEWAARPGVNHDENDVPQPWVAPAVAIVTCRAKNEEMAKMLALRDNPGYHTVDHVKDISNHLS